MKHFFPWIILGLCLGLAGCEDKLVLDRYSTMRYDVLQLPTPADTMSLHAVDFVSAREGFVGGDGGTLFATINGGQSWIRRSQPGMGTIYKLLFSSPTTGWAGTGSGLYRTSNGGQSWTRAEVRDGFDLISGGAFLDLQFVNAQNGYAVAGGGIIVKTINGGANWTNMQRRRDKRSTFRAVSFTSVDSGFVVGDDRSHWRTTNGGLSWTWTDESGGGFRSNINYDVLRYNDNTFLLAGPEGFEAFYPASSGFSDKSDERYDYPIYGLASFGARGPVVAVGERSIIRHHPAYSRNENTPWAYVHAPDGTSFTATFYAADFADAGTFYAVGPRGTIHRFYYQ